MKSFQTLSFINYRSVGNSPIATATQRMQTIALVKIPAYPLGFSTEPLL